MRINQAKHAHEVATRFGEVMKDTGASLTEEHRNELELLIESALDAVLVEQAEAMATTLERLVQDLRRAETMV